MTRHRLTFRAYALRGSLACAAAIAALAASPLHAQQDGDQTDIRCLAIASKAIERNRSAASETSVTPTQKRKFDETRSDLFAALSWFIGRVSMLPAEVRPVKLIEGEEAKVGELPEPEFAAATGRCLDRYAEGRTLALDRVWGRP